MSVIELKVTSNEVGEEYTKALKSVLEVRANRRKQYGDTFLDDADMFLLAQMENKLKRFRLQFDNLKLSTDQDKKETALDSLKDLVNYAIFQIAKIEKDGN